MLAGGTAHRAGRVRPQLRQTAQQRRLAGARFPGDDHRVARIQLQIQRIDQVIAGRVADLDVVEHDGGTGLDVQLRQRAALLVGRDQAVQPDDGGSVAGEHVVGIAEERQRILDRAERRHRLNDRAELDLTGEQPRRLQHPRQRDDDVAHRQVPSGEHHGLVDPVHIVVGNDDPGALSLVDAVTLAQCNPVTEDADALRGVAAEDE